VPLLLSGTSELANVVGVVACGLELVGEDDADGCRETSRACEELGDIAEEGEREAELAELKLTATYIED